MKPFNLPMALISIAFSVIFLLLSCSENKDEKGNQTEFGPETKKEVTKKFLAEVDGKYSNLLASTLTIESDSKKIEIDREFIFDPTKEDSSTNCHVNIKGKIQKVEEVNGDKRYPLMRYLLTYKISSIRSKPLVAEEKGSSKDCELHEGGKEKVNTDTIAIHSFSKSSIEYAYLTKREDWGFIRSQIFINSESRALDITKIFESAMDGDLFYLNESDSNIPPSKGTINQSSKDIGARLIYSPSNSKLSLRSSKNDEDCQIRKDFIIAKASIVNNTSSRPSVLLEEVDLQGTSTKPQELTSTSDDTFNSAHCDPVLVNGLNGMLNQKPSASTIEIVMASHNRLYWYLFTQSEPLLFHQ